MSLGKVRVSGRGGEHYRPGTPAGTVAFRDGKPIMATGRGTWLDPSVSDVPGFAEVTLPYQPRRAVLLDPAALALPGDDWGAIDFAETLRWAAAMLPMGVGPSTHIVRKIADAFDGYRRPPEPTQPGALVEAEVTGAVPNHPRRTLWARTGRTRWVCLCGDCTIQVLWDRLDNPKVVQQ